MVEEVYYEGVGIGPVIQKQEVKATALSRLRRQRDLREQSVP